MQKNITQYRTADLRRKQFVTTMKIKHTIGYKVRIIRSTFYPYIFDSLDLRSWVKHGPSAFSGPQITR